MLFPANLWDSHWVVVAVDLLGHRICVLDPLVNPSYLLSTWNAVQPVVRTVIRLVNEGDFYKHIPQSRKEWKFHILDPAMFPKQPDKALCGPWCCMMIEDMIRGKETWTLFTDKRWAAPLRKYIAVTIYNNSLEFGHDDFDITSKR